MSLPPRVPKPPVRFELEFIDELGTDKYLGIKKNKRSRSKKSFAKSAARGKVAAKAATKKTTAPAAKKVSPKGKKSNNASVAATAAAALGKVAAPKKKKAAAKKAAGKKKAPAKKAAGKKKVLASAAAVQKRPALRGRVSNILFDEDAESSSEEDSDDEVEVEVVSQKQKKQGKQSVKQQPAKRRRPGSIADILFDSFGCNSGDDNSGGGGGATAGSVRYDDDDDAAAAAPRTPQKQRGTKKKQQQQKQGNSVPFESLLSEEEREAAARLFEAGHAKYVWQFKLCATTAANSPTCSEKRSVHFEPVWEDHSETISREIERAYCQWIVRVHRQTETAEISYQVGDRPVLLRVTFGGAMNHRQELIEGDAALAGLSYGGDDSDFDGVSVTGQLMDLQRAPRKQEQQQQQQQPVMVLSPEEMLTSDGAEF